MDKLVGIIICLVQNLITKYPIAIILIVIMLFLYYLLSRLLLKKIFGVKTATDKVKSRGDGPAELYNSSSKFAGRAAEFLIVLILIVLFCSSIGLIEKQKIGEILQSCVNGVR